jgi:hypothetical protein
MRGKPAGSLDKGEDGLTRGSTLTGRVCGVARKSVWGSGGGASTSTIAFFSHVKKLFYVFLFLM